MPMSENLQAVSINASADLSTKQFTFCVVNTSGQLAVVSVDGGDADGVLQDEPNAQGRPGLLAWGGITKVKAGGTITAGDKLKSTNVGTAATAASAKHVIAKALESGVSGDVIAVLLISKHLLA